MSVLRSGPLREGKGYRAPRPGSFGGARAVLVRNADLFWLSRVFCWSKHLDPAIDMAIEITSWLSLISKKKGHRPLIAASTDVLPRGTGNFSHNTSLRKCSDLLEILDFTRSLLKGARN